MRRLRTAQNYQKKAIKALFPPKMNGHLEVIESEMKAMFLEMVMEAAAGYKEAKWDMEYEEDTEEDPEEDLEKDTEKNAEEKMRETAKSAKTNTRNSKNHTGAKKVNIQ